MKCTGQGGSATLGGGMMCVQQSSQGISDFIRYHNEIKWNRFVE